MIGALFRGKFRSRAILIGLAAMFGAVVCITPISDYFTRFGYDFLLPAVRKVGAPDVKTSKRVVLIAEDEITHNVPPFKDTPDEAWAPQIAKVLDQVRANDPAVVGFDIIFPKTIGIRSLVDRYDVPMLRALRGLTDRDRERKADKIVLGYLDISEQKIRPNGGMVSAVHGNDNLRQNFVFQDEDSVTRAYPPTFPNETSGELELSFGTELAVRAGAQVPERDQPFLIDFRAPPDFEIYRLADLYDCAEAGDTAPFEAMRDKVVLFGTQLDVEDRHTAANRFLAAKVNDPVKLDCAPERPAYTSRTSFTMPGVYLHMHAIDQMLAGEFITIQSPVERGVFGALFGALFALIFVASRPLTGLLALAGGTGLAFGAGVFALRGGVLVPWAIWSGSNVVIYIGAIAYRVLVEGREKRKIRNAFQHYLAPELVAQIAEDPDSLRLGGERREAAIFFSDLAGFTTLSEELKDEPETLVDVTNMNLAMVSDAIERNGGYVDKYIGDAVMAVWGAPAFVENKATRAARAAIEAIEGLKRTNADKPKPGLPDIDMRVGLNLGTVIAGNMGSERRLNYTIVGDAVNLAARLEPACKVYGIRILAGEDIAQRLDNTVVARCVDFVAVKGKNEPVKVYEIVGKAEEVSPDRLERLERFSDGLKDYWARRFENALTTFQELAEGDPVATLYVDRTRRFIADPPADDWDGSVAFMTK